MKQRYADVLDKDKNIEVIKCTVMQRKRLCLSRFLADIINTSPYLIGQPLRAELSGTDGHIGK